MKLVFAQRRIGQRHFGWPYKHEAQASEYLTLEHTRWRVVLVFEAIQAEAALSNEAWEYYREREATLRSIARPDPSDSTTVHCVMGSDCVEPHDVGSVAADDP